MTWFCAGEGEFWILQNPILGTRARCAHPQKVSVSVGATRLWLGRMQNPGSFNANAQTKAVIWNKIKGTHGHNFDNTIWDEVDLGQPQGGASWLFVIIIIYKMPVYMPSNTCIFHILTVSWYIITRLLSWRVCTPNCFMFDFDGKLRPISLCLTLMENSTLLLSIWCLKFESLFTCIHYRSIAEKIALACSSSKCVFKFN